MIIIPFIALLIAIYFILLFIDKYIVYGHNLAIRYMYNMVFPLIKFIILIAIIYFVFFSNDTHLPESGSPQWNQERKNIGKEFNNYKYKMTPKERKEFEKKMFYYMTPQEREKIRKKK